MSSEVIAETVQTESATVAPSVPELSSLTKEERSTWRETGKLPEAKSTADVKESVPDSDPEDSPAVASDSATEQTQQKPKPHLKTKDDTEKRFKELTERLKKAEERAEAAERARQPERRESKQDSVPAPEAYKPLEESKYFADNPKATYEDFVRAAARHEAKWEAKQEIEKAIMGERQRISQEAAAKELTTKMKEAKERYPDVQEKVVSATNSIMGDQQIPVAIKALLNDSDVLVDLMYVLNEELPQFIELAKTNPAAALRKIVTTESLVKEQLSGKTATKEIPARGEDGKFKPTSETVKPEATAEPISRAPRPPVEIGGRSSAAEDGALAAVKSGDFRTAKAEWDRRYAAEHK